MTLRSDPCDQERYLAARRFIMGFVDRRIIVTDPEEVDRAILKVAEAIPPFTKLDLAAIAALRQVDEPTDHGG